MKLCVTTHVIKLRNNPFRLLQIESERINAFAPVALNSVDGEHSIEFCHNPDIPREWPIRPVTHDKCFQTRCDLFEAANRF